MWIFVERERRRPRAFWRLLVQFSVFFLLSAFGVLLVGTPAVLLGGTSTAAADAFFYMSTSIVSLLTLFASLALAARFLDRRRFRDYGFNLDRGWFLDLGFGALLGAALMAGIFLVQLAFGWITVTGTFDSGFEGVPFAIGILPPLVIFLCVGVWEESFSRGYQLKNIAEGLNYPALGPKGAVIAAWIITSAVFGLLHLGNPNASLLSSFNIALAGILLGVGYVLTGELAIPIGIHITWNFFQGNVFGFPVSGLTGIGGSFVTVEQGGPDLWTGGEFGPEAGLLDPIAVALGSLAIFLWVRLRQGRAGILAAVAEPPKAPEPSVRRAESRPDS
ncbi:CAAX protease self-immunity [Rubrobacter radiotolerans]|uniref:CAAX protease self-immunity n=1 Tax=Rubrobacter radiotolerans TaxID=42256 RepID=A0A023X793_RUBRA|nr:CAAX protease self-immunity [Rubrobacter radiotolerans]SMC07862.1 hypothetical protein SAMN00767673_2724 [Rubrobacter radiotolerans DSM 5868]